MIFNLKQGHSSNKKFKNNEISLFYLGVTRKRNVRNIPKLTTEDQDTNKISPGYLHPFPTDLPH